MAAPHDARYAREIARSLSPWAALAALILVTLALLAIAYLEASRGAPPG